MNLDNLDFEQLGVEMYDLAVRLYPICRSVTGPGVRATLEILQELVPLEICEVSSGKRVFDWEVPDEWHIHDAYIRDDSARKVVDFQASNLHVVGGSVGVRQRMSWSQLKPHLYTLPERPTWIPYRTAFYDRRWGFCLSHKQFLELEQRGEREYDVCIDASWQQGALSYGEGYLPGTTDDEVLISTHVCHPSLANDNISGIVVATFLARVLTAAGQTEGCRYSYRSLFIPATIGAITWLAENEERANRIKHGVILAGVGDAGAVTYRRSRRDDAEIDRAIRHVLTLSGEPHEMRDFEPFGYDQRQFCSPGFDMPVGCLMRTPDGEYPEYHSSADNLEFIRPESLGDTLAKLVDTVRVLEGNRTYLNLRPKCEPRLGRHGLYHGFGTAPDRQAMQRAVLWVLNLSDGSNSLLDIAERSGISFHVIAEAARMLVGHGLVEQAPPVSAAHATGERLQANAVLAAGADDSSAHSHRQSRLEFDSSDTTNTCS